MIISYKLSPLGKGFNPKDPHTAVTNVLLDYVSKYINKPDEFTSRLLDCLIFLRTDQ